MYRPEGWTKAKESNSIATTDAVERALQNVSFENGADAMLEGLVREHEIYVDGGLELGMGEVVLEGRKGYLVFIPEGNNG